MEIKEFVEEALGQLLQGVATAQVGAAELDGTVNPIVHLPGNGTV